MNRTAADVGIAGVTALALIVGGGCIGSRSKPCGNQVCPSGSRCVAVAGVSTCVLPWQLDACDGLGDNAVCDHQDAVGYHCVEGICVRGSCGDGVLDPAVEECDEGAANDDAQADACRTDCRRPRCGDGVIDATNREQCDDGANNSDTTPDACRTTCTRARCGDDVVDTNETCDDGNAVSGDGCSADCGSDETCGNGIVDVAAQEGCDCGTDASNLPSGCTAPNGVGGSTCNAACRSIYCGNGDRDADEECDDGNNRSCDGCSPICKLEACGNGFVDCNEGCDDGNTDNGDGCSAACQLEVCGNGVVDVDEECDEGAGNSRLPNATCRLDCRLARCGDGIIDDQSGEICDHGAANSELPNALCRTDCTLQTCGDGVIDDFDGETCDRGVLNADGQASPCRTDCTGCGDGVVQDGQGGQPDQGEECDDGNARSRDGCSSGCTTQVITWTQLASGPVAVRHHSMAYDAARGDILVNPGELGGASLGTMIFDGTSWSAKSPDVGNCSRMVYDATHAGVVAFGGSDADCNGVVSGDTMFWTGASNGWTPVASTGVPGRGGHAMAYDSVRGVVVLFGGYGTLQNPFFDDTWEWDGASWTQIVTPGAHPSWRANHSMTYDQTRRRVVLFGGQVWSAPGGFNETWLWDGVSWEQVFPVNSPPPAAWPDFTPMDFDAARGVVVHYNGTQTWEWDGTNWSQVAPPATPPDRYSNHNVAYDSANGRVIMYGGQLVSDGTLTDDTWAYGPSSTWPDEVCDNATDDDGDHLVDCADPDCNRDARCAPFEICDNATDDDGNGLVDCADPRCGGAPCGVGLTCAVGVCQ